ncbi:MAG TPA: F0F1 ATP synthase subunit A [Candidatus Saccharimonadales bacterium]|nr:F0F1 ATP synthase subunit A [Candidatus Saccharimonadales bacterium]
MLSFFAAETLPVSASPLFQIGGLTVTNSMLTGALTALLVIILFSVVALRSRVLPRSRFVYFFETVVEFVTDTIAANFEDDTKRARKFAGLFIAFFVFILINNLWGLLPGMGGVLYANLHGGLKAGLLRAFTTDLNGTLALSTVTMATVEYYSIRARGGFGYIKHFFSVAKPWWNPMNAFLGPIEIISEATRLLTLALRLFGVIYAGDVLLDVIAQLSGNFAWAGTVPIVLMEIFFASIQAYLFIMLSSVYLQMGTTHEESESHHAAEDKQITAKAA